MGGCRSRRGILTYLLDKPPGWDVRSVAIAADSHDGKAAVQAGLRELARAGYYRMTNAPASCTTPTAGPPGSVPALPPAGGWHNTGRAPEARSGDRLSQTAVWRMTTAARRLRRQSRARHSTPDAMTMAEPGLTARRLS